jgi:tetratricopeptide (TPR) repeat protein
MLAATSTANQPGSPFMAGHRFPSFAKLESFLFYAALVCVLAGAQAFAKGDGLAKCRTGDPDSRIAACSEIIGRGSHKTKRNQLAALINRAAAYRAKGEAGLALADLDKALELNPKSPAALLERASLYLAKGDLDEALVYGGYRIRAKICCDFLWPRGSVSREGRS